MPNMTLNEALTQGLQVTGVGLIIVFSVLLILMLVMMAMKPVFYKEDKPVINKPEVKVKEEKPAFTPKAENDSELIAVISAAVAACMDVPVSSINIKSYKKVGAWNKAGVRDIIDSRF